jgi:hypothetical protein
MDSGNARQFACPGPAALAGTGAMMADRNRIESMDEMIRSVRLRALVRYWNGKRAGQPMPSRAAIDPIEIPRILPIVLLADATPDGARMRLLGTEATGAYGRETRGRLVHEIQFGEFDVPWQGAFGEVVRSAAPTFAVGTSRRGTELCRIETVLMPLTDDGSAVSQIFGGLVIRPLARDEAVERERARAFIVPLSEDATCGFEGRRAEFRRI